MAGGLSKMALIFVGVGIAAGIGITLVVVNSQTQGMVFQRVVDESEDNLLLNPSNLKSYEEMLRVGAHYKSTLAVGEEGFFNAGAKGGKEPYAFEWKFSDGAVMNAQNVTRSFDSPGRYTFDLTVTDANGKQDKSTAMYVDVGPKDG